MVDGYCCSWNYFYWLLGGGQKKGSPIGAPALKPPVDEATPAGMKSSGAALGLVSLPDSCDVTKGGDRRSVKCILDQLRSSVFATEGPTFLNDLATIDRRLAEYNMRAEDSQRLCLTQETKAWAPTFLNEAFPMQFSCFENMSAELSVYFGTKDDQFYLSEIADGDVTSTASFTGGIFAKANKAGNQVESWKFAISSDNMFSNVVTMLHVDADRSTNVMEFRAASNHSGLAEGCGVHFRSNGTFIKTRVWSPSQADITVCDTQPLEVCLNASDLNEASDATSCAGITFANSSWTRSIFGEEYTTETAIYKSVYPLLKKEGMPELTEFNTES